MEDSKVVYMIPTMNTIPEEAEITGLSKHYIRKLCQEGTITFVKAGRKTLVNHEKFIEYLNGEKGV